MSPNTSLCLPIPPYLSLHLPISPYLSLSPPISPHISPYLPDAQEDAAAETSAQAEQATAIDQTLLRKYLMHARHSCRPVLQDIDQNKLVQVYTEP